MNEVYNNLIKNTITEKDLIEMIEELKPKKILFIGNKELYNKIIAMPNINKEYVKFSSLFPDEKDIAYIVDMEMIKQDVFNACKIPSYLI